VLLTAQTPMSCPYKIHHPSPDPCRLPCLRVAPPMRRRRPVRRRRRFVAVVASQVLADATGGSATSCLASSASSHGCGSTRALP
jgi:hypothetical protein